MGLNGCIWPFTAVQRASPECLFTPHLSDVRPFKPIPSYGPYFHVPNLDLSSPRTALAEPSNPAPNGNVLLLANRS